MENNSALFDVLLEDPLEVTNLALAEALAAFKKIPLQDATFLVRHCWGFALTGESEKNAKDFILHLQKMNIRARAIPSEQIKPLPPAQRMTEMILHEKDFEVKTDKNVTERISPDHAALITAACLPIWTTKTTQVTTGPSNTEKAVKIGLLLMGVPVPLGGKKKTVEKKQTTEEFLFYMDILIPQTQLRFHIDAQHFSFSFLKELKQYTLLQNFKTMLSEILRRVPKAIQNKGARMLLKNESFSKMNYESMDDYEKEMRALLTLN